MTHFITFKHYYQENPFFAQTNAILFLLNFSQLSYFIASATDVCVIAMLTSWFEKSFEL